jgi:DNA-binding IscR family transcriptional regulator
MLALSQTTGYAILALSCLEDNQSRPRLIRDIAERTGLRKPYLAKIFN